MIDWSQCPEVESDPKKLGGKWLFKNTRLPINILFGELAGGATIGEFVEWYPGVEESQVIAVLEFAARNSLHPDGVAASA